MGESIDFDYLMNVLSEIFWGDLFSKEEVDEIQKIPSHSEKVARLSKKLRENSCSNEGDVGTVFNELVSEAFNIFFFIETINNELDANKDANKYREKKKEMKEKQKIAYDVFTANSAHIEIEFNDNLHKVYFMIQPACRYLDDNKKSHFMNTVNRGTANEKITDLMASTHGMFDVMDHMSTLKRRCPLVTQSLLQLVRDICLAIIAAINLFIFALYDIKVESTVGKVDRWSGSATTLHIMGGLHIGFSFVMIILWFILDGELIMTERWRKLFGNFKKFLMNRIDTTSPKENEVWELFNKDTFKLNKKDKMEIIE